MALLYPWEDCSETSPVYGVKGGVFIPSMSISSQAPACHCQLLDKHLKGPSALKLPPFPPPWQALTFSVNITLLGESFSGPQNPLFWVYCQTCHLHLQRRSWEAGL